MNNSRGGNQKLDAILNRTDQKKLIDYLNNSETVPKYPIELKDGNNGRGNYW